MATKRSRLDAILDADDVVERLRRGDSRHKIAAALKVPYRTLADWLDADPTRSARARDAVQDAADAMSDKAEEVLTKAKNAFGLAKARELAQHYRWKAKVHNPQKYSDKQQIDLNAKVTLADALRVLDQQ